MHYTTSCNTQSSAPEDGRNYRQKHVELIGIINKPLLLHLVGVYIIYINDAQSNKYHINRKYYLSISQVLDLHAFLSKLKKNGDENVTSDSHRMQSLVRQNSVL